MIKALAHACILSSDLERTRDFYENKLGLRKHFDFVRGGQCVGFYFEIGGGQFVEVFHVDEAAGEATPRPRLAHLCFEVEDVAILRTQLQAQGVEVTELICAADHTWQFWCKDPDGVDLEFQTYTEKSCQITGEKCVLD